MPDGKRKRRFSSNLARRRWYAQHRSHRFCRRFGWQPPGYASLGDSTSSLGRTLLVASMA